MAPHTAAASGEEEAEEAEAVPSVAGATLRHRHAGKGAEVYEAEGGEGRNGAGAGADPDATSVERVFADKAVPSWREQLTLRAFVVSALLAVMFSVIVMKLNLTTGIIPSLNVSAGLLGFFFVRLWTSAVERIGLLKQPFTRQENTVIQTCVVSAYGIAFSGGFGSYLFGMSETIAKQATEAKDAQNIKDPHLGWMIGFLFLVSFIGLFALVPLRKIMIVDYKLTYPSGTATAYLINGFHTPEGAKLAKKQVKTLGKYFLFSFFWGFFQWFYTAGDNCGFNNFPTLGLEAYNNRFFFDFSPTYVGVGMICPYIQSPWASGLQGFHIHRYDPWGWFIQLPQDSGTSMPTTEAVSFDDERRTEIFLKDQIPKSVAYGGYAAVAAVSIGTLPQIFPQLKWYYILVAYVVAPVLAFCNAYGSGLTDWSLASTYGKLAIFVFGAWAGLSHGGVLVGLAACGVMMSIVSTASDLMQDFKTGYLTLASPRSMFISQVIGTGMGCVIGPCVFWLFYKAFSDIGTSGTEYPAPYAIVYRNMAILGVDGFSSLPENCLTLCYIFFAAAIAINLIRDLAPHKVSRFIPLPMAMAIPFYIGSYFAIDMFLGSVILFVWEKLNKAKADAFGPAVASGLICGDGIWTLPQSILALAKVKPPICMKFLSRAVNAKVDSFLAG
ncbi:hypothetical protein GUJ93_ZPchr0006g46001 [Zizania palustris]|uniref:Uncharacterized protein n=1 Tax=Zizania palustris TaxID=103762 RepID=A0A8J5T7Q4_ZIZPA|nr:hypothetical protein GUJ93_ZPchr0006g46001 [Zizania palustris]